ncbi:hypothetical protein PLICRDRAFT_35174 [Plicaturopsis crispa FD-325 SS-3]|nr:hypothetical protein PLICRDRAFT_35174 [Plicaturopsis crispa FD-325 SS-3]
MGNPVAALDAETVAAAAELHILDANGHKVLFGSVYEDQKTILVFIRHFFCGNCQQYVTQLASVPQDAVSQAGVKVVVVGCGGWQPIKEYAETTGFRGEIYADPSRKLYHALGMTTETLATTPAGQPRRSYLTSSVLANALRSIWTGPMKNPTLIGKQGSLSQLGGDFVFGPGNQCSFAHRMQHTEDHIEVEDLMRSAGVAYS